MVPSGERLTLNTHVPGRTLFVAWEISLSSQVPCASKVSISFLAAARHSSTEVTSDIASSYESVSGSPMLALNASAEISDEADMILGVVSDRASVKYVSEDSESGIWTFTGCQPLAPYVPFASRLNFSGGRRVRVERRGTWRFTCSHSCTGLVEWAGNWNSSPKFRTGDETGAVVLVGAMVATVGCSLCWLGWGVWTGENISTWLIPGLGSDMTWWG